MVICTTGMNIRCTLIDTYMKVLLLFVDKPMTFL
jgi:hypothetical protein